MENVADKYLLMIEPDKQGTPRNTPIEDELTKMVDEIFATCKPSTYGYRGIHVTECGKMSDNHDWILPNMMITHNLIGYYIRHYREFIPQSEIEKIHQVHKQLVAWNAIL